MRYCSNCGTEGTDGQVYCGACGTPLPADRTQAVPQPQAQPRPQPRQQPQDWPQAQPGEPRPGYEYGAPRLPDFDWRTFVVGNWVGAAITAAAILATAGILSTALGLLAKPDNFGIDNTLTLIASILGATFGADAVGSATAQGTDVHGHLGIFPLTVSVVTAVAGFLVFRRVTARYPEPTAALADAARTALLVAVPLLVFALVFRSDTRKVGSGWGADLMSFLGVKTAFGSSVVGCLFLGFLTVFCTLAVSVFWRRDWWGPRMQKAHEWLAAPLYGGATTLLLLPLAGLIGIGLLLLFGESNTEDLNNSDDWMAAVALAFGLLANGGMWLISLGAGASYGVSGEYRGEGEGESDSEMHRLKFFTEDEPGLWAAPVVALVVMVVSAFVVARKSAHPTHIAGNLLRWVGLLFVFIPLMIRLASVHAGFSSEGGDGDYKGSGFVGPDGVQTTFFLAGIGLVCAIIVAAISRAIDLNRIKAQLSAVGAKIQSSPAPPIAPNPPQPYPPQPYPPQQPQPPAGPPPWDQPPPPPQPPPQPPPTSRPPWDQPPQPPGGQAGNQGPPPPQG